MTFQTQEAPQRPAARPETRPRAPAPGSRPAGAPHHRMRWLILAIAIVVIVGAYLLWRHGAASAKQADARGAQGPIPVIASAARRGDMPVYLMGLGTVTPLNTVTVRARVDGQIDHVAFVEGQFVHQGDLLLEIDPRPFEVQLTQAEGQLAKDESALKNAQLDLERDKLAKDAISQQQLDTQMALVDQDAAAIKVDHGQIDASKLNLVYCRVTAPFNGRIGLRLVDEGNIVYAAQNTALAVITQLQPITVIFPLPEDDIPQIMKSMQNGAMPQVDAYDRDMTTKLATGVLLALDSQVSPSSGTVLLKASFENKDFALFPNQFVNAELLADTEHNAIIVPAAAVQRGPDGSFVWVIKADQTVDVRTVTPGTTEADQIAINDGLAEGEQVVVDGFDKLQPGSKVSIKEAGATTQPGTTKQRGATSGPGATTRPGGHHHNGPSTGPAGWGGA